VFPFYSLASLLPEGGQALAAGLHPEILRAWLDTLSGAPPEEVAAALKEQLKRTGFTTSVTTSLRARLKMLDIMAEETWRISAAFEAELDNAHHPLSTALQRKVIVGNDLLKNHAQCYRAAANRLRSSWIGRGNAGLLRHTLVHAMAMERRRLILAYRAYAPGSKSAWRNLTCCTASHDPREMPPPTPPAPAIRRTPCTSRRSCWHSPSRCRWRRANSTAFVSSSTATPTWRNCRT
jgi:hypothetical protein